ncbi:NPC intracellular cholesterol transporter 1-like [Contarinia nasturtii]|uniref:NPC intracellular cholesterol transporter 1-like n=1 Tax=Contarinia nasturtii TaxID=265458 RepID=UPI0012D4A3E2|nr:NPC intracellular cholesterol transporter 1-like [Contarinia nasturtii]
MIGLDCIFRYKWLFVLIICSLHYWVFAEGETGQCIWYGVCRNFEENDIEKSQYCSYNGTAKLLNEDGRQKLSQYCSHLDSGENNTFTCCDNDQIEVMNDNIERAEFVLSKCPACFHNFLQPICEMTCSPNQTNFLKVQKIETDDSEQGKPYVTNIDFSISYDYLNATFQSCSQVSYLVFIRVLDLMCGAKGSECTPERWFSHMGNATGNKYVPFQINYITETIDDYIPFNKSTVPCNESVDGKSEKCSCLDCNQSCS